MRPCAQRVATLPAQMMKYLGASIAGTLVHYGILTILVLWFTLAPIWASTCGAIAGALVIYLLNYFVTFHSTRGFIGTSSRFFLIAAIGTVVNGLVLDIALTHMNWPLSMAQVCATGVQFSVGFAVHRVWTF